MSEELYFVVGTGKSGIAAAELLLRNDKNVCLYDDNEELDCESIFATHEGLHGAGFMLGKQNLTEAILERVTAAVFSPGVPVDTEFAEIFRKRNIPIIGEVELAYRFGTGRVVAITGTNGKTTTTALTGEIMKTVYPSTFVVGNIGIPYTGLCDQTTGESVTVAEISSFMLETVETFHATVSAILNITPDHLNRHHTMENYIAAKENIVINQTTEDTCVLNYDDPVLREFGKTILPKCVYFSSRETLADGWFYRDGAIIRAKDGEEKVLVRTNELRILGQHNYENVCAAAAMAEAMEVPFDRIREAVKSFNAVEHRIEFVREWNGITFYNDSKGTNPDAAIKAVEAMERPTVLIGGGYDKGSTYDEWIESFGDTVKHLVLIGETKEAIADCAKAHGFLAYEFADSFTDAIDKCVKAAKEGDAILLSPACASWDMFPNFEVRGEEFKEYVNGL